MARQRCQLARIGAFVEREEDDREVALVAVPVEQRAQRLHVIGAGGNIGALVAAEGVEQRPIVVAARSGVELHDQSVIQAHSGHLGQHLRAEQLGIARGRVAVADAIEQRFRIAMRQVGGGGGGVAVVARSGAHLDEEGAALAVGGEIAVPGPAVFAGQLFQPQQVARKPFELGIDHRIGAIGGDDPAVPLAVANGAMVLERIERAFGGGQHLEAIAVEQRPRTEVVARQRLGDDIEIQIAGFRIQPDRQAEHLVEHPVEPHPARRAAKQVVVFGQDTPGGARIGGASANPQILQLHTLRIEHAEQVMVGHQQQFGGIFERGVLGEPLRIGMPVRADDRQAGDVPIQHLRDGPGRRVRGEQPIGVKVQGVRHAIRSLC